MGKCQTLNAKPKHKEANTNKRYTNKLKHMVWCTIAKKKKQDRCIKFKQGQVNKGTGHNCSISALWAEVDLSNVFLI